VQTIALLIVYYQAIFAKFEQSVLWLIVNEVDYFLEKLNEFK